MNAMPTHKRQAPDKREPGVINVGVGVGQRRPGLASTACGAGATQQSRDLAFGLEEARQT